MQITKQGSVEYYDSLRGFGFIIVKNDDGSLTKFFVHKSQLLNEVPNAGSIVRFVVGKIPPGRTLALAENVCVLKDENQSVAAAQTEMQSGGAL